MTRQKFALPVLAGAFALALSSGAQAFPDKPVTIIVPFGAGGGTDITTRTLAGPMAKALGGTIVVKNTAGAGGTIGAAETARAKPDGYTVGMMPVGPMTTQPHLRKLPYDPASFDYVCQAYSAPSVLVVRKDSKFNSLKDIVDYGKANPGKLNFGIQAVGAVTHIGGLGIEETSGIKFQYIPFKGSAPTFKAMLDGTVDMFVAHISFLTKNADQVKSVAVLMNERVSTAKDLATAKEQGFDLHVPIWGGLVAPKGIPAVARSKLEKACEAGMNSEGFTKRMAQLRMPVTYLGGNAYEAFVKDNFVGNEKLLRKAGLIKK